MTQTSEIAVARPAAGEYAPYYEKYVGRVPEGDVVEALERQGGEAAAFFRGIPADLHEHRYAPEKWSIKEVVGHIADAERIFAYRLLRIGRGDAVALPGFDENAYVPAGEFGARTLESLVDELESVRRATLTLARGLPADAWARVGTASENPVSARALAYILWGHLDHHLEILRTRYLGAS
ncbi:MAG TPA: DinB family protein [Longimicrobium sp.]|nr:DinB family protein [Longimicrobium sp.]